MPIAYVITVQGYLDDQWSAWFDGLTMTHGPRGETVLAGWVEDQAALHGVLIKIRDLGVPLLAVLPGDTAPSDPAKPEIDEQPGSDPPGER